MIRRKNCFQSHSLEQLSTALQRWACDQRERQHWNDADAAVYRYRADLLEMAAKRLVEQ